MLSRSILAQTLQYRKMIKNLSNRTLDFWIHFPLLPRGTIGIGHVWLSKATIGTPQTQHGEGLQGLRGFRANPLGFALGVWFQAELQAVLEKVCNVFANCFSAGLFGYQNLQTSWSFWRCFCTPVLFLVHVHVWLFLLLRALGPRALCLCCRVWRPRGLEFQAMAVPLASFFF